MECLKVGSCSDQRQVNVFFNLLVIKLKAILNDINEYTEGQAIFNEMEEVLDLLIYIGNYTLSDKSEIRTRSNKRFYSAVCITNKLLDKLIARKTVDSFFDFVNKPKIEISECENAMQVLKPNKVNERCISNKYSPG